MSKPKFLSTQVTYDLTKSEIEDAMRKHLQISDGSITWDITGNGKVRGASVSVRRTEIQGDL